MALSKSFVDGSVKLTRERPVTDTMDLWTGDGVLKPADPLQRATCWLADGGTGCSGTSMEGISWLAC